MANHIIRKPITVSRFRKIVYAFFQRERRDFPWRHTTDPYHILVSEVMLQQTQASRVVKKYNEFIRRFPTARRLARALPRSVLRVWQGLGYNRRALQLREAARFIINEFGGRFPKTIEEIDRLPGVGSATARAIYVYAYNRPTAYIETNIRTVFLFHFFRGKRHITDETLLPLVEQALDRRHPRRWYTALMDYGTFLKKAHGNPGRASAHYVRQAAFRGSTRQRRGVIVRELLHEPLTIAQLTRRTGDSRVRLVALLNKLEGEGILRRQGRRYRT